MSVYNVADYGAQGTLAANDRPAIQDAINAAAAAGGGTVQLMRRHGLGETIVIEDCSGVTMQGLGGGSGRSGVKAATVFKNLMGPNEIMIRVSSDTPGASAQGIRLRHFALDGQATALAGIRLQTGANECVIEDVFPYRCKTGVMVEESAYLNKFRDVNPFECTEHGFWLKGKNHCTLFEGCFPNTISVKGTYGWRIGSESFSSGLTMVGCGSQVKNAAAQVWVERVRGLHWAGGYIECPDLGTGQNPGRAVLIGSATGVPEMVEFSGLFMTGSAFVRTPFQVDGARTIAISAHAQSFAGKYFVTSKNVKDGRIWKSYFPGMTAVNVTSGWKLEG